MQQKVEMPQIPAPKPNLAERLSAAQQRHVPVPTVSRFSSSFDFIFKAMLMLIGVFVFAGG